MCGDEVVESILKIRDDMPIIFCSGTINEKTQGKFKRLSNVLFFRKPISLELLNSKIHYIVNASAETNSPHIVKSSQ